MTKSTKSRIQEPKELQEMIIEGEDKKDARVEFEQRFEFFMSQFRTVCQEAKSPVAFAIVIDPQNPSIPFVYGHGHIFDQATLLVGALRDLKRRINEELSA